MQRVFGFAHWCSVVLLAIVICSVRVAISSMMHSHRNTCLYSARLIYGSFITDIKYPSCVNIGPFKRYGQAV